MKKITSIALIFLMSLQCLYKLGVITYFQLNRDYIAEVLCINKERPMTMCYGQCFLDKNLDFADNTDDSALPNAKHQVDFPVFLISENHYTFIHDLERVRGLSFYLAGFSSDHSSVPFHPPASLS